MVPRAVHRDVRISYVPSFLMIQVAPTTDVQNNDFWSVRFPSHLPAMALKSRMGLAAGMAEQPVSTNAPMTQMEPANVRITHAEEVFPLGVFAHIGDAGRPSAVSVETARPIAVEEDPAFLDA